MAVAGNRKSALSREMTGAAGPIRAGQSGEQAVADQTETAARRVSLSKSPALPETETDLRRKT